MPPRGDHETPDVALAEQEVMMLDQPRTGARHELGLVEDGGRFPTKIGHEPAFGMQREFAASEQPECRGMVLEQGPATPAIERPDRGNPRRHAIELAAEMIEDLRRNELHGVERSAGHLEETDLEGERQPVQRGPASPNGDKFLSSSVKKCSISSADNVSGNRSSPRYRCSHRLIREPPASDRTRRRAQPQVRDRA